MTIEIPQPYLIVVFGAVVSAIVGGIVAKLRSDRRAVEEASEIIGTGERPGVDRAHAIVGANATLQRANQALLACNNGLEAQIKGINEEFAQYKKETAIRESEMVRKVKHLEEIIADMTTVQEIKTRRVKLANEDGARRVIAANEDVAPKEED